ncbi:MAG: DNA-binding protein [Candidatus Latescibacteria bacterium]|nr:DNA-binding protein [Candidatus Latescibacterota bacterium]
MSTKISGRLADTLAIELDHISKETERSKSYHIQKAVEMYLAEQADFQIAHDRLTDHNDLIISLDDMRAKKH